MLDFVISEAKRLGLGYLDDVEKINYRYSQ